MSVVTRASVSSSMMNMCTFVNPMFQAAGDDTMKEVKLNTDESISHASKQKGLDEDERAT